MYGIFILVTEQPRGHTSAAGKLELEAAAAAQLV